MATADVIPDADISVAWTVTGAPTHEGAIDEAKGSPNTSDYISASQINGDDNDIDLFNNSTIADISEATQAQVYIYHSKAATYGGRIDIGFSPDGINWEAYQTIESPESYPTYGWGSKIFAGLSMTQANLNACRVRFRADVALDKQAVYIATCYIVITYSTAEGYGHKFLGILPAKIGKVCGIPTAKVGKIKGV